MHLIEKFIHHQDRISVQDHELVEGSIFDTNAPAIMLLFNSMTGLAYGLLEF